jgi:hypothetical protein
MRENGTMLAHYLDEGVNHDLVALYDSATDRQKAALLDALRKSHSIGQSEAEKRTGRIIASVLAPLLGVRQPDAESVESKSRIRGVLSAMRNLTG